MTSVCLSFLLSRDKTEQSMQKIENVITAEYTGTSIGSYTITFDTSPLFGSYNSYTVASGAKVKFYDNGKAYIYGSSGSLLATYEYYASDIDSVGGITISYGSSSFSMRGTGSSLLKTVTIKSSTTFTGDM